MQSLALPVVSAALALLLKTQLPSGSELVVRHRSGYAGRGGRSKSYPHRCKIKGFSGEDATPALEGADVVLISAGVARKPGMDRSDLFNVNAGIVKNLVQQIAKTCPQACIGIITNPVNTTVAIAAEVLKKPACTIKQTVRRYHAGHHPFQYLCGGAER